MMPLTAIAVSGAGWVGAAMTSLGLLPADTDPSQVFVTVSNILCSPGFFGLVLAAGLLWLFFRGVDRAHGAYRTPSVAIVVQAVVAVVILLGLETFQKVLDFTVFAILLATLADTAALYTLRRRQPDRPAWPGGSRRR